MKNLKLFLSAILLLTLTCSYGQGKLYLQKKGDPKKQITIDPKRSITICSKKGTYTSQIVAVSDSSVSMLGLVYWKDSTHLINEGVFKNKYKAVLIPVYKMDTVQVFFKDMLYVKKHRLDTPVWDRVFGGIGLVALTGFCVMQLGDSANESDKESEKEPRKKGFGVKDALLCITVLAIVPLAINKKYDLRSKWEIKGSGQ